MIVDTSALLAYFDTDEHAYAATRAAIDATSEPLVVSPYVVAETDYLISERKGEPFELATLRDLAGGAWDLAEFGQADLLEAIGIIETYADQRIGVTDASIVVLAKRYDTRTIATLDRRHFDVLRPLQGGRFEIVP